MFIPGRHRPICICGWPQRIHQSLQLQYLWCLREQKGLGSPYASCSTNTGFTRGWRCRIGLPMLWDLVMTYRCGSPADECRNRLDNYFPGHLPLAPCSLLTISTDEVHGNISALGIFVLLWAGGTGECLEIQLTSICGFKL